MNRQPKVTEIKLSKDYKFMYENFVISTQNELYLMLEEKNGLINVLKFSFLIYKYGYPNDEGLGVHSMAKYGLRWYGFYHVVNSIWINELNEKRPKVSYDIFADREHYIITFKDVTLDIISDKFEEVTLTNEQIYSLIKLQISYLTTD